MAGKSSEVRVAIVADNSSLNRGLQESQSRLAAFGKSVAKTAAVAGVAAAAGLAVLGKASVEAASQAQQSIGATETVFGRFADNVIKTSNRAATALGLSANEYRENANVLGALLSNQGVQADKLAGKTKNLVAMGADLAATFGGTTTQAVEALASAFKGEFDPLEQYGVSIKQSTINTEAMRVAGVKTTAAFNDLSAAQQTAAKQTATTNLLTKQTTKTQGAFARETNTLAHQQQVLSAQWTDLKTQIGNALLPAVTNLFKSLTGDLMPALSKLADEWLPKVGKALKRWTKDLDVTKLLDGVADALEDIDWSDFAAGASELGDAFSDLGPALHDAASTEDLNSGLKVLATTVAFLADHLDTLRAALPYLVTGFVLLKGAQLANQIAGRDSLVGMSLQLVATNRLTAANKQLAAAMREVAVSQGATSTGARTAATQVSKLGQASKLAAGAAGIGALTVGAESSNEAVSVLMSTMGGAATGFAVGGPWGALIGGAAGAALGIFSRKTETAEVAVEQFKPDVDALANSFEGLTARINESTRAQVLHDLQEQKLTGTLAGLGISQREAVNAALGNVKAQERIAAAYADSRADIVAATTELGAQGLSVSQLTGDLDASQRKWTEYVGVVAQAAEKHRDDERATASLRTLLGATRKQLEDWPRSIRSRINNNFPETRKDAKRLADQLHLLPEQRKILLSAPGLEETKRKLKGVRDEAKRTGEVQPDFSMFKRSTESAFTDLSKLTKTGGQKAGKAAADGLKAGAKPDLSLFKSGVTTGVEQTRQPAYTGGYGIGSSLKSGTIAGVSGLGSSLAVIMAQSVRQGINAARAEADAHSPSRETEKLGLDLTAGLVKGVQKGSNGVADALQKLTGRITKLLDKQLADRLRTIRKRLDGKAEAAALKKQEQRWKAHARAVKRALADEQAALRKSGKEQDRLRQQLDAAGDAYDRVTEERDNYVASIKGAAVDYASVVGLDAAFNPKVMLAEMRHRLEKIRWFNSILQDLLSKGLSVDIVDQLARAGVEGGLATALAIQQGGQAAIDEFTQLQNDINAAAGELGATAAEQLFADRIARAEARVKRLKKEVREAERKARQLARELQRAIRQAVDIDERQTGQQRQARLTFDASAVSATSQKTAAQPQPVAVAAPVANTYSITVNAPVGASPADIGRTITTYIDAYEKAGGRRRA